MTFSLTTISLRIKKWDIQHADTRTLDTEYRLCWVSFLLFCRMSLCQMPLCWVSWRPFCNSKQGRISKVESSTLPQTIYIDNNVKQPCQACFVSNLTNNTEKYHLIYEYQCVYVCLYVCVYVCMCVCVYVCVSL